MMQSLNICRVEVNSHLISKGVQMTTGGQGHEIEITMLYILRASIPTCLFKRFYSRKLNLEYFIIYLVFIKYWKQNKYEKGNKKLRE